MGPWKWTLWTLCVSLLVCCVDGSASNDQTAKPGDNVTLQCLGTRGAEILLVKWIRPDLKEEEGYVFFFRNNRPYENNQHPSFHGRVKLINPEKDGDFSVILKNVRISDTGTYECHVGMRNNPDISVHNISLTVTDSHPGSTGGRTGEGGDEDGGAEEGGDEDGGNMNGNIRGHDGLIVGLSLLVVMVVVVVVVVVVVSVLLKYKRHMKKNPHPPPPPDEEAGDQQLL